MLGKIGSILTSILLSFFLFAILTGRLSDLLMPSLKKILGNVSNENEKKADLNDLEQDYYKFITKIKENEKKIETADFFLDRTAERVDHKIKIMNELEQKLINDSQALQKLLEEKKTHDDDNISTLTKLYANMPDDEAAAIINKIDETLALKILKKIKTDKAAAILSLLRTDEAVRLSNKLAQLK
ncbi:MAG: hypothetical protein HY934_01630 [Candidatus Firestonebacteria bacterium]|nr:hypothetical protein [Candidatus Firestonebacteria bacterium]